MPELPEVETIVRKLRPALVGKSILSADLRWPRTLAAPSPAAFAKRIKGQQILSVSRRAKFFDLRLSTLREPQGKLFDLIIHLRMSGDLLVREGAYIPAKHDRLVLTLSDDLSLVFNDPRKFGRVWLTADPDEVLGDLGPEPLDPSFTPQIFYERLHIRRRQLKPLLLDQTFIAGLGNIYTDEALHMARLHPLTLSNSVTETQVEALWRAVREVLEEGIRSNGASIDWVYRGGEFQNRLRVYGRAGEPCPVCGTKIERLVIGQRGAHFCPACQPFKE
ncbi:MAG: bifunctional DNA-formamidopyrimidine glycosylase/DNA-(apurinic or apyrimidinic site) lyase [Chloroflexi bacterium]|nr:bifunctional DNA-formamidopyrimidine glycosylase/DNA-(apurinic or apyrimidinic site) lyase [Chloroflexota bacterium]